MADVITKAVWVKFNFRTTFVKDMKTYWVRTESNVLSVLPNTGTTVRAKVRSLQNKKDFSIISIQRIFNVEMLSRYLHQQIICNSGAGP